MKLLMLLLETNKSVVSRCEAQESSATLFPELLSLFSNDF